MEVSDGRGKTGETMKTFVGDSVYAEWDGYELILTTDNGYPDDPRNRIVLDPQVWSALVQWLDRAKSKETPTGGVDRPTKAGERIDS